MMAVWLQESQPAPPAPPPQLLFSRLSSPKKTLPSDKGARKCGCHVSNPFWGNRLVVLFAFGFPFKDFHGGSDCKASAYNAEDPGSIPGLGRSPGEGNGNPLQYSCLENPMGWRSLVGYSQWGHKESDITE